MDLSRQQQKGPVTCYKCGQQGHFANRCPNKKRVNIRNMVLELSEEDKMALFNEVSNPSSIPVPPPVPTQEQQIYYMEQQQTQPKKKKGKGKNKSSNENQPVDGGQDFQRSQ